MQLFLDKICAIGADTKSEYLYSLRDSLDNSIFVNTNVADESHSFNYYGCDTYVVG